MSAGKTVHAGFSFYNSSKGCPISSITSLLTLSPSSPPLVENVQLSLVLKTENKGSVVAGGELNVCLDGMVVDLGSLPNGNTAAESESHLYHTHTHTRTQTQTQEPSTALMHSKALTMNHIHIS